MAKHIKTEVDWQTLLHIAGIDLAKTLGALETDGYDIRFVVPEPKPGPGVTANFYLVLARKYQM